MNTTGKEVKWIEKRKKKGLVVQDFHFPAATPCYSKALKLWTEASREGGGRRREGEQRCGGHVK